MEARRIGCALMLSLALIIPSFGQGTETEGCAPEELNAQQNTLAGYLSPDFAGDYDLAIANLFRLGALYQSMALRCGYMPSEPEIDSMLEQALRFVTLEDLIAAQSVGNDVAAILLDLEETYGDPLAGQLLYNGLEPALGGVMLGCAGCHENEAVAPLTAGTWTRINDFRLGQPAFRDYSHRQYLVESIVRPMAYTIPDYAPLMPDFYGSQLSTQHLADLVAFLDSQDQLLDDE
ncbi:MAG: hypothetical protein OXG39_08300 [Chloroflexi bacterium]|nr:hypothetical protein [Chloroflexota bacterium]